MRLASLATAALVGLIGAPASATERRCHVDDHSGAASVVVSGTPGGAAFSRLANGADVSRAESARDAAGRSWVFVHDAAGRRLGWLPSGAVRCP